MSITIPQKLRRLFLPAALVFLLAGCGGTWVDDDGNFKRVFDFSQPQDVKVIHSYYWKSPHWTTEYRYYIELEAPADFVNNLTAGELMTPAAAETVSDDGCLAGKPRWFLSKAAVNYDAWIPKRAAAYRVFRDKEDGRLFVCDEQL